ncbi:hypothetical protein [Haliea sp. E17]|uniref:hypothetical protein n=1 Tax=Haliea sp. E17 TaxID=3401576 RepID=UPI003AAABE97
MTVTRWNVGQLGSIAWVILGLLIALWIYWPGIDGPILLDDRSSVGVIDELDENTASRALDYVLGDNSGMFGRAVSMSTFVLERILLGDEVRHSKQVNILLHLLNGALVIYLLQLLFRQAGFPSHRSLGILLGLAWVLHPLLVSTTLYVVQRMAMLTATFMFLGCIAYCKARMARSGTWQALAWALAVPVCLLLAIFSKENGLLLVPVLLVMEVLWFGCKDAQGRRLPWLARSVYGLITAGGLVVVVALVALWRWLETSYHFRPFSLVERLLTQSRILWDYLGQWFWPQPGRMGIYHDDIVISRSLLEPSTTLPSLIALLWMGLLFFWLVKRSWGRYVAFGVAWFAIGHSMESTVWPLELYFEHRNYFPAVGILIVVGALLAEALRRLPEIGGAVSAWLAIAVIALAVVTSSQVTIWSSHPLLILAQLNGHPQSARANTDMAVQMAQLRDAPRAREYSLRAHRYSRVERDSDRLLRDVALSCIAGETDIRAIVDQIGVESPDRPISSLTTMLTVVRLAQDDVCPGMDWTYLARRLEVLYLVQDYEHKAASNLFSVFATLENALGRPAEAYAFTERFLALSPGNPRGLLMQLHFARTLQKDEEAQQLIEMLRSQADAGKLSNRQKETLALYTES